jgi:hypothetical protein
MLQIRRPASRGTAACRVERITKLSITLEFTQTLVRLYDLYALTNLFKYWSPDAVLLLGWPPRFWKRAGSRPSHPFFNHSLLSRYGGTLAAGAKQRAVERAREKGVTGNPSLIPHQVSRDLARVRVIATAYGAELIELAKRAITPCRCVLAASI